MKAINNILNSCCRKQYFKGLKTYLVHVGSGGARILVQGVKIFMF
jgi:hypothetical protein